MSPRVRSLAQASMASCVGMSPVVTPGGSPSRHRSIAGVVTAGATHNPAPAATKGWGWLSSSAANCAASMGSAPSTSASSARASVLSQGSAQGHQQPRPQRGDDMMVRAGGGVEPLGVGGEGIGPVFVDHGISLLLATAVCDGKPLHTPMPRGLVSPRTDHSGHANPENVGTPQALPENVHKRSHTLARGATHFPTPHRPSA
jgi:hypothetical protein